MKFEIDFNKETDDKTLELLGATLEPTGATKYPPFDRYIIELADFKALGDLLEKVNKIKGGYWSAIISNNPMVIYLDKDI